jgi:hypothetical protein
MTKKNNKNSSVGTMINTGVGTMVGMGMMGATAGMINEMPAGTAKSIAGVVPGLQAASLVAYNVKAFNGKQNHLNNKKNKKSLW